MDFTYSKWRHGGWYVDNVRYPSGAVGCVSRNYDDGKWRIVCDKRANPPTYASRDAAAAAEDAIARAEFLTKAAPALLSALEDIIRYVEASAGMAISAHSSLANARAAIGAASPP